MKYLEYRDSSDRLTIGLEDMPSLGYWWVKRKITKRFGLKKVTELVKGVNEKFQSFSNSEGKISIDWDNWSGLTVTALDVESESLVLNIGEFLKDFYK